MKLAAFLERILPLTRWLGIGLKYGALALLFAFFGAIAPACMMLGMLLTLLFGIGDTAKSVFKDRSVKEAFQSALVFFILVPIALAAMLTPIHALYYFFLEHMPEVLAERLFQNPWQEDMSLPTVDWYTSLMAAVALPAIALVILRERFWLAKQVRQIENLATSKVNSAAIGVVELAGTYQPGPEPEGADESEWNPSRLKKPFYLEDATGRVLVDPSGAQGVQGMMTWMFHLEMAEVAVERRSLSAGDPVFVVGSLENNESAPPEATGTAALVVRRRQKLSTPLVNKLTEFRQQMWGGGVKGRSLQDPFFIADCDEPEARRRIRAQHRRILWRGAIMVAACLWLLASRLDRLHPRGILLDDPGYYTEDPAVHEVLTYAHHPVEGYRKAAFVAIRQGKSGITQAMHATIALDLFLNSPYADARSWASWNLYPDDGRDSNPCGINTTYSRYTPRMLEVLQHKHTNPDERKVLLRLLARIREPREQILPVLQAILMQDPEPGVRQVAAWQLASFTPERGQILPALAAMLESADPAIRIPAEQELEALAPGALKLRAALGQAMADPDYYTRHSSRLGLVRFGDAALPELERVFQTGAEDSKCEAVWGMLEVNPAPDRLLPFLRRALQSEHHFVRMAAVGGVCDLKAAGQPLHDDIKGLLHHTDPKTAMAVLSNIAKLEPPPDLNATELAIVRNGLRDPSDLTRQSAIQLLKRSNLPREEIVRQLLVLSQDPSPPEIRGDMLTGLAEFPECALLTVPRLLECLADPKTRVMAAVILGKIGPAGAAGAPQIVAILRDKDSWDRDDAAAALRGIGAFTTLGECLGDADGYTRSYAYEELKKAGPAAAPAVPALIERLQHPMDAYDVGNALATLKQIGPAARAALPAVQALLEQGPQEQRPWFAVGEVIVWLTTPAPPPDWAAKSQSPPVLAYDFENTPADVRRPAQFTAPAADIIYSAGRQGRCIDLTAKTGMTLEHAADFAGGYTLEVAFRPGANNPNRWREPTVLDCDLLRIYTQSAWTCTVWLPNSKNLGSYVACPVPGATQWQHIAVVWNPPLHQFQVYANGKRVYDAHDYGCGYDVVEGVYKLYITWPQQQLRKIVLGACRDGNSLWEGSIDDLKLYDYPRSPEQITAAAAAFAEPPKPTP